MTRRRKWVFVGALVLVLGAGLVVARNASGPSFADFRRDADRVRDELREFHKAYGHYPMSLDEAGIEPPNPAGYGGWQYTSQPDGHGFRLGVGEAGRERWMMTHRGE